MTIIFPRHEAFCADLASRFSSTRNGFRRPFDFRRVDVTAHETARHRPSSCRRTNKSVPRSRDRRPACSKSISHSYVAIATGPDA